MKTSKFAALVFTALATAQALAQQSSSQSSVGGAQALPEPGSLPLVVLALVGAVAVARFIKRK